jgi:hypothetical protein
MGVEMADLPAELVRQDQRLAEAADAVRRRVADEVAQELSPRRAVAGEAPRRAPGGKASPGLAQQVFGEVEDRGADLAVDRVDGAVGRMAQRDEAQVEPELLEAADLLGDEGFRQPRIALEDDGDRSRQPCRVGGDAAQASRRRSARLGLRSSR